VTSRAHAGRGLAGLHRIEIGLAASRRAGLRRILLIRTIRPSSSIETMTASITVSQPCPYPRATTQCRTSSAATPPLIPQVRP
jgi:hypothetical protein